MRSVFVRVVFLRLGDIETAKEVFKADVLVQYRWREPTLDNKHKGELPNEVELTNPENYWNPKMAIDNNITEVKGSTWHLIQYNDRNEAYICERRRVKTTFYERMEVNQFPFDKQDLTLSLTSLLGENEVQVEEDRETLSIVHENAFTDEQEWYLHKEIRSYKRATTNAYQNQKHKHPTLCVAAQVTRRAFFFVTNIVIISLFICGLVFTTFAVDYEKIQNRLQLSFILLLSNITFKFAVSQSLPKVSYLTVLDKYILSQMAILGLVTVWHAIVFEINDNDDAELADIIALCVLGSIYIVIQVIFFTYWAVTTWIRGKVTNFLRISPAESIAG